MCVANCVLINYMPLSFNVAPVGYGCKETSIAIICSYIQKNRQVRLRQASIGKNGVIQIICFIPWKQQMTCKWKFCWKLDFPET